MAEEKKPKIDLKARLGKKTVPTKGGPAVPPPVGIPKPTGVPMPPFGMDGKKRKKVDASDPYAAIEADDAPARAEPQAIKVEMSEEVVKAQRKGRAKIVILAVAAAVVGGGVGFAVGSGVERGKGADKALQGAKDLAKEVDTATVQAEELADILKSARMKLGDNKFPAEEVSKLGGIHIDFEGRNLAGRGIGRFKPILITQLVEFAGGAQEANDQKDKVAAVLAGSKKGIEEYLAQEANPKVRWSVYVSGGPQGPWAVMQPLPKPFLVKSDKKTKDKDGKEQKYEWPKDFKIKDGGKEYTLKRYTSGNPMGREPNIIPVDPSTQSAVCPSDVLLKLRREISDLEETLRGRKSNIPGQEKKGLMELGREVTEQLKGIGTPG